MSRAGAGRGRYGVAAASPSNPRRHQAGNDFSERRAYSDPRDYGTSEQEDSGGQTPSSQEQQEQHLGAYRVIPPNPTKRNQLQRIANKELEDLAKWKEQNRPGPITLRPQRLGGRASEAEVRQNQQLQQIRSKYQRKAIKLEENQRQQEWQRRQMLEEDHNLKTTKSLSGFDSVPPSRSSCQTGYNSLESSAWARGHAYREIQKQEENRRLQEMKEEQRRKAELLELKQKQEERTRINEQQRVNNAFLDRLQNSSQPGGIYQSGRPGNMGFSADSWDS